MNDIWRLDATQMARLVRAGDVSSRELVEAAFDRIEALDPRLGAVVGPSRERALAQARDPGLGPFAGVPFLAKDLLAQPGLRCAFGSRLFGDFVPPEGSPYASAVDAAGLITLGKTTSSEFGLLGSTETLLDGTTCNPWDLSRSAGGSSGGSAAAVAAGLVPMAHASDGGGSIRLPSALCGLFGFKPSRGRCLPAMPVPEGLPQLTIEHCVSRSVRDSAGFLAATEDPDTTLRRVGMVGPASVGPLRIGWYTTTLMGEAGPPEGIVAVEAAAAVCEALGHHVEAAEPPPAVGPEISEAFFTIAGESLERMTAMVAGMRGRPVTAEDVEPFTWSLMQWCRARPEGALARARMQVEQASRAMASFLASWDVVLCPTSGVATPALGFLAPTLPFEQLIGRTEQLAGYTPAHNIVGAPAMSVPMSHGQDGLPVGCHFASSPGRDACLLELAYQLEEANPWSDRWPALAADANAG